MAGLELRDIEVFLTLAEELHFGRTARRLYLSTGRVSQTISTMERELGGPLFARNPRQVRLTPLGEQFRAGISAATDQVRTAISDARSAARGAGQVLRIGYASTLAGSLVADLAARFEAVHPDTVLSLKALPAGSGIDLLGDGRIDAMLTWSPGGDGSAIKGEGRAVGPVLATEDRAVLVPDDHPLAQHDSLSIENVADFDLLGLPYRCPSAFRTAWTPRDTPSGKIIRVAPLGNTAEWGDEVLLADLLTTVVRIRAPHLTIQSLLAHCNHPGLRLVPVRDLPPCVLLTAWQDGLANQTVQTFVRIAGDRAIRPSV